MILRDILFACLSGIFITLSLAPFNVWPLALLSAALLFAALKNRPVRSAFYLLFIFSGSLFLSGASWVYVSIHEFGYAPVPLSIFLTVLFCAALALINACAWLVYAAFRASNRDSTAYHPGDIILFAACGVFTELLRTWLFSGFPWMFAGYSQTSAVLAPWAPLIGVYGISFLIYASGATLYVGYDALLQKTRTVSRPAYFSLLATLLLCWLLAPALEPIEWTKKSDRARTVSLIQTNISQHDKWRPELLNSSLQTYMDMSKGEWAESELVIWPEAAIAREHGASELFLRRMDSLAKSYNSALVTGIPYRHFEPSKNTWSTHNSVIAIGSGQGIYHKQKLVPFGEFVPLEKFVGRIMSVFDLPLSSMQRGAINQPALTVNDWQTRPLICYEIVYPGLTARTSKISDVLLTVSNDSWFGASLGPLQHLQMAQMRALENGRYVLRSTGNGVSAVIDAQGSIVAKTEQFERSTIKATFYLYRGLTPWSSIGYWLVPATVLGLLFLLCSYNYYRRRNHLETPA